MGKKPHGGPHTKERKVLLERHGQNYVLYRAGKLTEAENHDEVQMLEGLGISFPEIVKAREKALRGRGEGRRVPA